MPCRACSTGSSAGSGASAGGGARTSHRGFPLWLVLYGHLRTEPMDFGRYEILDERARGACGIVYRARDRELDRIVALKALRHDDAGPLSRERFLREARLAAWLDHPNIVRILGTGDRADRLFYTMPLLEGEPLNGPLPPSQTFRLMEPLAHPA